MIYIEKSPELKNKDFVLEDELLLSDDERGICAYVIASDSLVRAVIDEMEKDEFIFEMPVRDMIEHDDTTMNFYALYDPKLSDVSLIVCFEGPDALYEEFGIRLDNSEKKRLIGAIEDYAIETEGISCEDIIEDCKENEIEER